MQGGGVVSQRNDVLVRGLRVVLASGAEEGEMQLELAPVAEWDGGPLAVSCVVHDSQPKGVRWQLVIDGQPLGTPFEAAVGPTGRVDARRSLIGRRVVPELDHLERWPEVIDLRRSGRFPKALCRGTHEDRLSSGHDDQQASRFREGKPMLEMRSRAQRPVLVVRVGSLQRRTGMNGERVESTLLQRRRDFPRQLLDVCSMQIREFHGDYAFKSLLLAIHCRIG